ncbi:MAG: Na+/H+ antiporter NhaC family protein [Candidatus Hydrothermales bacterium]
MRFLKNYLFYFFVFIFILLIKFLKVEVVKSFLSVLPPLLAVILAIFTRKLILSLFFSIFIGGLLLSNLENFLFKSLSFIATSISDFTNIQILLFVVFIMSMITLITASGGFTSLVKFLMKFASTRRRAQFITVLLGFLVFIDDYANTMVVGTSARPITDKFRISREKLAFLVDATSAPVAGLSIISTWIGYEVGLFNEFAKTFNISKDGYSIFFDILKFRFYCIFLLIFVFFLTLFGKDFGYMKKAEERAKNEGKLLNDNANPLSSKGFEKIKEDVEAKSSVLVFIIPVLILFLALFTGLWVDGNGFKFIRENFFNILNPSVWLRVLANSKNNISVLAISSFLGLLSTLIVSKIKSGLNFKKIFYYSYKGAFFSYLPITILVLAWSLKNVCVELKTAEYLIDLLKGVIPPKIFPALTFITSCLVSFATGTSWGTMAIIIPIAGPVAFGLEGDTYGYITIITLASVLDGAIFGDHCSPISDTTIMSSIFSSCDHIDHVKTQLPYSVFVATFALTFGYLLSVLDFPPLLSTLIFSFLVFILLKVL